MIISDLRQMSNHRLCKDADSWSWAMQSRLIPGDGHEAVLLALLIVCDLLVAPRRYGELVAVLPESEQHPGGAAQGTARARSLREAPPAPRTRT